MAAVAEPGGAREALSYPDTPISNNASSGSPAPGRSPRCEAFVMTGDKILSLDHHVSPSYAKAVRDQLPPLTHIQETPKRPPLTEFPSVRRSLRSKIPVSASQPESIARRQTSCPEKENELQDPSVSSGSGTPSCTLPPPVEEAAPLEALAAVPMESSMHSSYYKSAFSNPQLAHRSDSNHTFVISSSESPAKHSTVTVHATAASVSATASPSLRRILSANREPDDFGSFRSDSSAREEKEASRLALRLYRLDGCSKTDVASRLNDIGEFASLVTTKYLELFNFSGIRIDAALRDFLGRVELRGESSQRERLLRFFSTRYHEANPILFNSVDEVHTLTCALLLLNSDLHGPNSGKKMSVREFINNIGHTGVEIKRELLKTLYTSIKDAAIAHNKEAPTKPVAVRSMLSSRQVLCDIDPESQVEYKSGWIMRKSVYDSDGAKTPFGRRGWKMWFARLRGLVLYLCRDEGEIKGNKFETFNNSILLHHAFAEAAKDYKKRQHIFRVRTSNLGEYLFQTSSAVEVEDWVAQLNFASAAFSSRSLPPPTGSQLTFIRSRLPKLPSQAPLSQQLKSHESAAAELNEQLSRVREDAPPLKARGRSVEEFFFRERYLTQEIKRYEEYATLLRRRLGAEGSESTSGVHSKSDIVDDDKLSYKEAMHH